MTAALCPSDAVKRSGRFRYTGPWPWTTAQKLEGFQVVRDNPYCAAERPPGRSKPSGVTNLNYTGERLKGLLEVWEGQNAWSRPQNVRCLHP